MVLLPRFELNFYCSSTRSLENKVSKVVVKFAPGDISVGFKHFSKLLRPKLFVVGDNSTDIGDPLLAFMFDSARRRHCICLESIVINYVLQTEENKSQLLNLRAPYTVSMAVHFWLRSCLTLGTPHNLTLAQTASNNENPLYTQLTCTNSLRMHFLQVTSIPVIKSILG